MILSVYRPGMRAFANAYRQRRAENDCPFVDEKRLFVHPGFPPGDWEIWRSVREWVDGPKSAGWQFVLTSNPAPEKWGWLRNAPVNIPWLRPLLCAD
jgi:hypothetical protein